MTKKMTKFGAQQGDVDIVPVNNFPTDAQPTKTRIVAYGESTGHNHQIIGVVDMRETDEAFYFQVAQEETAQIVHIGEEHEAIEITPGQVWRVAKTPQVEYDGSEERRISD